MQSCLKWHCALHSPCWVLFVSCRHQCFLLPTLYLLFVITLYHCIWWPLCVICHLYHCIPWLLLSAMCTTVIPRPLNCLSSVPLHCMHTVTSVVYYLYHCIRWPLLSVICSTVPLYYTVTYAICHLYHCIPWLMLSVICTTVYRDLCCLSSVPLYTATSAVCHLYPLYVYGDLCCCSAVSAGGHWADGRGQGGGAGSGHLSGLLGARPALGHGHLDQTGEPHMGDSTAGYSIYVVTLYGYGYTYGNLVITMYIPEAECSSPL